jgi:hypothetical protein
MAVQLCLNGCSFSGTSRPRIPEKSAVETEFNLSGVPIVNSMVLTINGLVQTRWTLLTGLFTVVLPVAPPSGAVITATYQILVYRQ